MAAPQAELISPELIKTVLNVKQRFSLGILGLSFAGTLLNHIKATLYSVENYSPAFISNFSGLTVEQVNSLSSSYEQLRGEDSLKVDIDSLLPISIALMSAIFAENVPLPHLNSAQLKTLKGHFSDGIPYTKLGKDNPSKYEAQVREASLVLSELLVTPYGTKFYKKRIKDDLKLYRKVMIAANEQKIVNS